MDRMHAGSTTGAPVPPTGKLDWCGLALVRTCLWDLRVLAFTRVCLTGEDNWPTVRGFFCGVLGASSSCIARELASHNVLLAAGDDSVWHGAATGASSSCIAQGSGSSASLGYSSNCMVTELEAGANHPLGPRPEAQERSQLGTHGGAHAVTLHASSHGKPTCTHGRGHEPTEGRTVQTHACDP